MKKYLLLTLINLTVLATIFAQSTNTLVNTVAQPAPATVHQITIQSGSPSIPYFLNTVLPKIDPQSAAAIAGGQNFKSLTIYPNADGSYGATVIFQ